MGRNWGGVCGGNGFAVCDELLSALSFFLAAVACFLGRESGVLGARDDGRGYIEIHVCAGQAKKAVRCVNAFPIRHVVVFFLCFCRSLPVRMRRTRTGRKKKHANEEA